MSIAPQIPAASYAGSLPPSKLPSRYQSLQAQSALLSKATGAIYKANRFRLAFFIDARLLGSRSGQDRAIVPGLHGVAIAKGVKQRALQTFFL